MRRSIARMLVGGLLLASVIPTAPAAAARQQTSSMAEDLRRLGKQFTDKQLPTEAVKRGDAPPKGPNPWLSLLPPEVAEDVDIGYWKQVAQARSQRTAAQRDRRAQLPQVVVDEQEPDGVRGANDTQGTAELIGRLGAGSGDVPEARILGTLASPPSAGTVASAEDDGAIPLANATGLTDGQQIDVTGEIGDGPNGSAGDSTGDFDHYAVPGLSAGDRLLIDVDTPDPFADLDPTVTVYGADGTPVAFGDDDGESLDTLLSFTIPADGDYDVAIEGFGTLQQDPLDSGSGIGVGSEGAYTAAIWVNASDTDFYSFDLEAGDVVSATVDNGGSNLRLFASDGTEVMGSSQDFSFIYPAETKLTGGGNAVLDHVAATDGRFALAVSVGAGDYDTTVRVLRPGADTVQTVFLDFDGEEVNTRIFSGGSGVRQLSPLSAFLVRWGLTADDEDALIDTIVAEVRENLRRDLQVANPNVRIRLRTSVDHPDRFGRRDWSRVIVGGTIEESGIPTIGIAQSIDPGNYGTEDTALVLLDVLSGPPGQPGDPSLNTYITPASDVVGFVGQAVGNVVSHEIGHYIGNWHVDQFNTQPNLMDQGGNYPVLYGVGPDNIGGTADDIDVDFGEDVFNPFEGFTGLEDTLNRSAFGLIGP